MSNRLFDKMARGLLPLGVIALNGCESLGIHDTASLLSPTLQRSEIVGFVAGLGTTFAALPDLLTMFKRRSSGLSVRVALLRPVDCFATGDRVERGRDHDQRPERRGLPSFRPKGTERKF
jgi:hypothetical protein